MLLMPLSKSTSLYLGNYMYTYYNHAAMLTVAACVGAWAHAGHTVENTAFGMSSPAYPALVKHVPMSRTMALTSSTHAKG